MSMAAGPSIHCVCACVCVCDGHSDDENKCMQEKVAYHNSCLRSWVNGHVSITMAVRLNCTLSCMQYLNIMGRGTVYVCTACVVCCMVELMCVHLYACIHH